MRDIPILSPVLHALTFRGTLGRVEYGIWLGIIALAWLLVDVSYHWASIPMRAVSSWHLRDVLALLVLALWLSAMVRRLRGTSWRHAWLALPLFLLALPFVAWALMVVPAMIGGNSYREAMRGASQDGAIQLIVTGAGMLSPLLAWIASFLFLPLRPVAHLPLARSVNG